MNQPLVCSSRDPESGRDWVWNVYFSLSSAIALPPPHQVCSLLLGLENTTCRITKVTVQKTTSFGAGGVISLLKCLPGVYEELDLMHGVS